MRFELKTITGFSYLFYISPSYGRAVVVSIIIRDTNIVKNNVFEPFLRRDSISSLNFATGNQQRIFQTCFWTEENHRYVILVLNLLFTWKGSGGLNNHQTLQYRQEYCLWTIFVQLLYFWDYFFHKKPTNHRFKHVFNWRQSQVYHPCSISNLRLKELWWYQSSSEIPISSILLSLNQFCIRIPFLGLPFS